MLNIQSKDKSRTVLHYLRQIEESRGDKIICKILGKKSYFITEVILKQILPELFEEDVSEIMQLKQQIYKLEQRVAVLEGKIDD